MLLPYSKNILRQINTACEKRKARQLFFAEDTHGRVHAAIFLVWDENSAYYLMGGRNHELRNSGANSLLIWEAIKFAATVTKKFDFEGSMMEPVERFCRAFGARQKPYFILTSFSRRGKIIKSSRDLLRSLMKR